LLVVRNDKIIPDKAQLKAIAYLNEIAEKMVSKSQAKSNRKKPSSNDVVSKKNKLIHFFSKKNKEHQEDPLVQNTESKIKGMYIWGKVGRGKTWLMDEFYKTLSISNIQRLHFHEFMLLVHKQLQDLPVQPDPLEIIGSKMSKKYQLICLDEFHVMDIADAVILHGLLKSLFENNVVIVTTSNRHPDDLYKNGSHRERFLPAIDLIKQNMQVFFLDTDIDYRNKGKEIQNVFFVPHNEENQKKLETLFVKYAESKDYSTQAIRIYGREIPVVRVRNHCIWFTFDTLCRGFRSSSDYLQIAKEYKVIIVSNIPVLHEGEEGPAKRFLNMIDSFYDQHVYLILSSSIEIEEMYQGGLLEFEFERATSRLHEMKSYQWWQGL